jgi:DNA invertase Pin-like site-specific DNA recombinase
VTSSEGADETAGSSERVSGTVPLMQRTQFAALVEQLEADETIEGVLVKNFSRLGRNPAGQMSIKQRLEEFYVGRETEIFQVDPWDPQGRDMPDAQAKKILRVENLDMEMMRANNFWMRMTMDLGKSVAKSVNTARGIQQKKERDDPFGNTKWGLTTDRKFYNDVSEATERLPDMEDDRFAIAVRALNRLAAEGYTEGDDPPSGVWSEYKEYRGSPSDTLRNIWQSRDRYREAYENARANKDFDMSQIAFEERGNIMDQ